MGRNLRKRAAQDNSTVDKTDSTQSSTKRRRSKKNIDKVTNNDSLTSPYFKNVGSATTTTTVLPQDLQPGERLNRDFYNRDTISLSKALLGKVLCRKLPGTDQIVRGTIVETEAYPGVGEFASQSCKGVPTERTMAMFMDPGTAYVYMTYGMYYCFNISSADYGGATLLRAAETLEDYEIMHTYRQSKKQKQGQVKVFKRLKQHELANGPSKLCLAFEINRNSCDKTDMTVSDDLWMEESHDPNYRLRQFEIKESRRVGIDSTPPEARNKLFRYFLGENLSVSKAKFKDVPSVKKVLKKSKK